MFTWKVVMLLLPKKWHKMIWVSNRDSPFSTLLPIGHMTDESVIRPTCNIPTLLYIRIKSDVIHIVMWVAFPSSFEVNWTSHISKGFSLLEGWRSPPPTSQKFAHYLHLKIPPSRFSLPKFYPPAIKGHNNWVITIFML